MEVEGAFEDLTRVEIEPGAISWTVINREMRGGARLISPLQGRPTSFRMSPGGDLPPPGCVEPD